ncbi:(2Fe-2S)-binding protein [Lentzea sp. NPDC006480]|uniref:(2Fe-2S)-binding protein n=1 Tax=Lentzea sp. NPDC006480 TaxID=3157176 RepID=UPI0033A3BD8C
MDDVTYDPVICVCAHVTEDVIISAIGRGARTLEAVRVACQANTGCGGCAGDIEELLEDFA